MTELRHIEFNTLFDLPQKLFRCAFYSLHEDLAIFIGLPDGVHSLSSKQRDFKNVLKQNHLTQLAAKTSDK
jgi:hypothetical protein